MLGQEPSTGGDKIDAFMIKLHELLAQWSRPLVDLVMKTHTQPSWAHNCSHLLYSTKSIPPVFEIDKLYISYTHQSSTLGLRGQTKTHHVINRQLNVQKAGSAWKVSSLHKNLQDNTFITYSGIGANFESALNNYFTQSDLKSEKYSYTDNLQKQGDAFLLPQAFSGDEQQLIDSIVDAVRKMIKVLPEHKHKDILGNIETNLKNLDKFLENHDNHEIVNYYDARLWIIVETVCNHFEPLDHEDSLNRKALRDHIIAECCTHLLKNEDIVPDLESYFLALQRNAELKEMVGDVAKNAEAKQKIRDFLNQQFCPELATDRGKIEDFYKVILPA